MLFISLRHSSPVLFSLIIPCLILAGYSEADAAFRFTGGKYSIGYRTHEETEDGKLIAEADSLSQRLSLSAINRGNLYNMRSSPYFLFLDYTHQRHSTNIQGSSYSPSASDLIWDGDITIKQTRARGLSLYAMSNKRENSFFTTSALGRRAGVDYPAQVRKEIYSEHGISIIKGHEKTLKSFLSYYSSRRGYTDRKAEREFSHLSLQRGINWLHIDLEETNNAERRSIRVGNVMHRAATRYVPSTFLRGSREWFRLTNWLEISTDLDYSTTKSAASDRSSAYRVSFFGKGYRKIWSMFVSPGYSASKTTTSTASSLSLPLSVRYFPDYKFELSSATRYAKSESMDKLGTTLSESESISESLSAIIKPQGWLTLRPSYSISRGDSNGLISLSQSVALGLTAIRANLNTSLISSYGTSSSERSTGNDSKSDNFSIRANVRYWLLGWVRSMAFSHKYAIASNNSGDKTELNLSEFELRVVPSYRSKASFRVIHSEQDVNGSKSENTEVNANLYYDTKKRFSNDLSINMTKADESKLTRLQDRATYKFTKNLESITYIETTKSSTETGDTKRLSFDQSIYYSYYAGGFLGRKLCDLSGAYNVYKSGNSGRQDRKRSRYSVAINYYPSRVFTLGGSYSYSSNNTLNIRTDTRIYANVRYPKLKAGISYKSASNKSGGGTGEKIVETIGFSLTKYF